MPVLAAIVLPSVHILPTSVFKQLKVEQLPRFTEDTPVSLNRLPVLTIILLIQHHKKFLD